MFAEAGYQKLDVWKRSRELVRASYEHTNSYPTDEKFGLVSQMRRAAVSISVNIAEGYGRNTPQAYVQFLRIAKGSANELEVLLVLSQDLGMGEGHEEILGCARKIGSQLYNLIKRVEASKDNLNSTKST